MVIMFRLNQAALLSFQLIVMCQASAEFHQVDHRDESVSMGGSVTLTCNTSLENTTLMQWIKGTSVFSYAVLKKMNSSNFTSDRLKIDLNSPLKLNVYNAQQDDAGLYNCTVTGPSGSRTTTWNLIVSEESTQASEEIPPSWYFLYIIPCVIGFLLCVFTSAVCLCRKVRARTPNQSPGQDQFHLESGGEVPIRHMQAGTDGATNNKRRSQYMERFNSIYGAY